MSEINREDFLNWAINHFGDSNVIERGQEICINSPFVPAYKPDHGHHLYCNAEKKVYHCWKSGEKGNLFKLVSEREGCPYSEAQEILGGNLDLRNLNQKIEKLFSKKTIQEKTIIELKRGLSFPPETFKITSLKPEIRLRKVAENYLNARKIPIDDLYVCSYGKYADRIIIPYYGPDGKLIYFNGRDMTGKKELRYRGPEKEIGIGKGDVVWMKSWPEEGSTIHLTEGEFDAMSLCIAGFNGAACGGKEFNPKQLELLKLYNLTICFDLDKSGLEALNKVGAFMRANQYVRGSRNDGIGYIRPAIGYKDWNDMLIKLGEAAIHYYIKEQEKHLGWEKILEMRFNSF